MSDSVVLAPDRDPAPILAAERPGKLNALERPAPRALDRAFAGAVRSAPGFATADLHEATRPSPERRPPRFRSH